MATTAFDVVLKELDERREMISRALVSGGVSDFAEYRSLCGEVRGLSYAHEYVKDLMRKLERDDDE